ncbi:MAG: lytic murein transglycosylase [Magnetococcales bacterium]|nr:lytic murein transglycosylase [Magnetococcales bacterium]MBF0116519.1 lytic murein transglycosylase [Magnetococcales bacterium]
MTRNSAALQDEPYQPVGQGRKILLWRKACRTTCGMGLWLLLSLLPLPRAADSTEPTSQLPWLAEWVQRGDFEAQWLNTLLAPLTPDAKVLRLMDSQAEAKPYFVYRKNFINERRIQRGRVMMRSNRNTLQRIQKQFRITPEVVVALWGVESHYGQHSGGLSVLRTLYTLAAHYPRRAPFFQEELRQFLLLCQEENWDPNDLEGSYAGAIGQMQMMPSTLRKYALDFSGDGKRDVFGNSADVLASIASFLSGHNWNPDAPIAIALNPKTNSDLDSKKSPSLNSMRPWQEWQQEGIVLGAKDKIPEPNEPAALIALEEEQGSRYYMVFGNFKVITQWNRSSRFAMVVRELADQLRKAP